MRSSCQTSGRCESSPTPFSVADQRLTQGGYLSGDDGAVLLQGAAAELFARWRHFFGRRLASLIDETIETPVFIDRNALTTSKYLAHFPQQVFVGRRYRSPRARARFMAPAIC